MKILIIAGSPENAKKVQVDNIIGMGLEIQRLKGEEYDLIICDRTIAEDPYKSKQLKKCCEGFDKHKFLVVDFGEETAE